VASASFAPSGPLRGSLRPPPDKSISHRAAIVGAMCEGTLRVEGYLDAADTRSTLEAVRALGAEVRELGSESVPGGVDLEIEGVGLRGPGQRAGDGPVAIDVGNAGTLMRLLPGWLAGQERGSWVLDGDSSIRRRPVDRIVVPLAEMGARAEAEGGLPPLRIDGSALRGTTYRMPVASAQVKSCVLLAGLLADGETTVIEPAPTRDHTERMLAAAGAELRSEPAGTPVALRGRLPGGRITVVAAERLGLEHQPVPADISSGAFALVAALLVRGSQVTVTDVGLNPTRIGLLGILNRMGASIEVTEGLALAGEPRGAVAARHGAPLAAARVGEGDVPLTIDELPLVALVGCFAEGETVVSGAGELRHKESDRIASVVEGLAGLGAEIEATDDGFAVSGTAGLRGGTLDSRGDHRLAMLGAVAGLASREGVRVDGFEAAGISYPGFEADLANLAG
jgi:3-phosphoshikimate 1-carboxyvinyltransferase